MAKAVGFCVEIGRNITLSEAHFEFFKKPPEKRERLRFQCGDPVYPETNQPLRQNIFFTCFCIHFDSLNK